VELHIVDPDPSWPAQFRAIATRLRAIVGDRAVRDTEDYPDLKDPVCDLIYLPVDGWAAATGWSPEPTTDG
jgi:hypothetical protein